MNTGVCACAHTYLITRFYPKHPAPPRPHPRKECCRTEDNGVAVTALNVCDWLRPVELEKQKEAIDHMRIAQQYHPLHSPKCGNSTIKNPHKATALFLHGNVDAKCLQHETSGRSGGCIPFEEALHWGHTPTVAKFGFRVRALGADWLS